VVLCEHPLHGVFQPSSAPRPGRTGGRRQPVAADGGNSPTERSAARCKSVRLSTPRDARQEARTSWRGLLREAAVLRRREKRAGLAQNPVASLHLQDLSLELLEPLPLLGREATAQADIPLGLTHSQPQRFAGTADLFRNGADGRPLRRIGLPLLVHQAHRRLPDLSGMRLTGLPPGPFASRHGTSLSKRGASTKPGLFRSRRRS
jgi:hypothetical protein